MVTIKDVAKAANVSVATASRALRNIGYLSPETKKVVLDCAKNLGYIADMNAQHLRNGKTNAIGIIVSDIGNYFYNIVISRIESELKKLGHAILLCYSFENADMEKESFTTLISAKVSSIIFTPTTDQNADIIRIAKQNGINVIQIYRKVYPDLSTLIFDDEYGAYLATNHLIENGAKCPLLLSVQYDNFKELTVQPRRSVGFRRSCDEHGISEYNITRLPLVKYDEQQIENAVISFHPDAILVATNTFAMSLLKVFKKLNIQTPKDIRIVTFDDIEWVSYLEITALHQPTEDLASLLLKILFSPAETDSFIKFKPQLIVRKSSLAPAIND